MNRYQRRVGISLLGFLILSFFLPLQLDSRDSEYSDSCSPQLLAPTNKVLTSSIKDNGNDIDSIMMYSRKVQGLDTDIKNSFANTSSHQVTLDFTSYQISGWSLYEILMNITNIAATSEREVVGTSISPVISDSFAIYEYDTDNNLYYSQLAQGFYNISHDGQLQNLSLLYISPTYDPINQNYAYIDLRSNYQNGSTNIVSSVPLSHVGLTPTWANVTQTAVLDASTTYYAVMNGTKLIDPGIYPHIQWYYQNEVGYFPTKRYTTVLGGIWGADRSYEAIMNYTYIPWNKTSNSALGYYDAEAIDLTGNSTTLSGMQWLFSSTSNISSVIFSTNQSVSVDYELTLRYRKDITSKTTWFADTSGNDISWNITSLLDYPDLSGTRDKNLSLTIPSDWTADHLFNDTIPTVYHDTFQQNGGIVECSQLSDAIWILACNSPNYIKSMQKFDSSDDSLVSDRISITVNVDINSTIESSLSIPATTGSANLRILYQSSVEYSDNITVTDGTSHHQWDIAMYATSNSLHTIELYWINGTEAGYLTNDIVVYYPTTLIPEKTSINAFTENAFTIKVYLEDIFTPQGLDGDAASVVYSFNGETNTSLTDYNNGTWTASVSTSGRIPGMYSVVVYAEGYAIENQSCILDVVLIHDTETLSIQWSNTNNISYVQTTNLLVEYRRIGGVPVTDATINVTINEITFPLGWDGNLSLYRITFNGTDTFSGFDTYNLIIQAWKVGHKAQSDNSQFLTIHQEYTDFSVYWSHGTNITYVEQTVLTVTYHMSNTSAIQLASVNVTDGITLWTLIWNGTDGTYWIRFNGTDNTPGIGTHPLTILAGKPGYENHEDTGYSLTLRKEPTSLTLTWSGGNTITYVQDTTLIVNYTMSDGSPITGAIVYVTINTVTWNITWDEGTETYRWQFFGDDDPPGIGSHSLTVNASRFGFVTGFGSANLVINTQPTTLIVEWTPSNSITYTGNCILSVSFLINSNNSAITDATIVATIAGFPKSLVWNSTALKYYLFIDGDIDLLGLGTFSVTVQATRYGFDSASDLLQEITLRKEPTYLSVQWANSINNPSFFSYTYLIVEYTYASSIPIMNAIVNVTINTNTWKMTWNVTEGYYQLRFNGSDSLPGVGTHMLAVRAWSYGYDDQTSNDEEVVIPYIPTILNLIWTNGGIITYVEQTTLQAIYTMYNDTWILDATVNVTINGVTLTLDWNVATHAYERTFAGSDGTLDFTMYPIIVKASQTIFQSQTNTDENLTLLLEPTTLLISWVGGNNITYFSHSILSVQFLMSNTSPISTGVLNATINGALWNLEWNGTTLAYEATIFGSDSRLGYATYGVLIQASCHGYTPSVDSTEIFTIRLEDTYLTFEWVSSNTISYLDVTILRIYYRYSNSSPVLEATINVSYVFTWDAVYNSSSGAYERAFTGSNIPSPTLGSHTFLILAWKANHISHTDISQTLTITQEDTIIHSWWLNSDNTITYVENTTLFINYSIVATGVSIVDAYVTIQIGAKTWEAIYNPLQEVYTFTFTGDMNPPGLGTHGLSISATYSLHEGFKDAQDNTQILVILSETVTIHSYWIGGGTITYVGSTILVVNYTMSNGSAIALATVNVTIGVTNWDLIWHEASQTYRLAFNGSDPLPGLGIHVLVIRAGRSGFDQLTDSLLTLTINEEPTSMIPRWSSFNLNNITYFEYTYLFVDYRMSNSSFVLGASVNVTIESKTWTLLWNITEGTYGIRFNGSDTLPGFGLHNLVITSLKYGFQFKQNIAETLEVSKDPTSVQIIWSDGNSISFVESTTLIVYYRMSNGTPIPSATLNVSFGFGPWPLTWNASTQAYQLVFTGDMDPPGFGTFSLTILASSTVFISQLALTSLTLQQETTSASASWISKTIDWTQTVVLGVEYRDSYGRFIDGATQKSVMIDGIPYPMQGTNGTYWCEFDNSFDLGHHLVIVNVSKYGYDYAVNSSISFDIIEASTNLELIWSALTIDYLGYFDLTANYSYVGNGNVVPVGSVVANITIDGSIALALTNTGEFWVISLSGMFVNLGPHLVVIQAQAYGYRFAESSGTLSVDEVVTDALLVAWTPSNVTIEYTDSLDLAVDYTFYGGDVPDNATVNVTINSRTYSLLYSSGAWRGTIPANQLGIGVYTAAISAWLYGYTLQTNITDGVNVTLAANSFLVLWEPWNLSATYVDIVNVSVVYTQDFAPIIGASVRLSINSTLYDLVYSLIDEKWHFSIRASDINLGTWNVTVTANKSGFADGWYSEYLVITPATTTLNVSALMYAIYYDESTLVNIYYRMSNTSPIPNAILSFTLLDVEQTVMWSTDHWIVDIDGTVLDIGVHSFEVNVSAYGFTGQIDTIAITVIRIPTQMVYDDAFSIYALESITLRFLFLDNRTSVGVSSAIAHINWTGPSNVIDLGNGTYLVQIGGSSTHVGTYSLEVILELSGYMNGTGNVNIDVYPIPTELLFTTTLSQYENETVFVEVRFTNLVDSNTIDWAVVIATLDGVQYILLYDGISENYTTSILLTENIVPNSYLISISANAIDCIQMQGQIELDVLAKSIYTLNLDVAEQVNAGEVLLISVTAYLANQPVANIELLLIISISSETGTRIYTQVLITDDMGAVTASFDVPEDATNLEIVVQYAGSISVWPAQTSLHHVDVTSSTLGILEMILKDPVLLSIVLGGISVPFIALGVLKKRRGHSKSMIASPIAASTEIIPEVASVDTPVSQIRNAITESESGLTRAEISERLGISSSKAGALVKDLLDSDSAFYEAREGTRRIIRKRE